MIRDKKRSVKMGKKDNMNFSQTQTWIIPKWSIKQNTKLSGLLFTAFLFSYTSLTLGLHCHRKHDHSTDVLLMGRSNEDLLLARYYCLETICLGLIHSNMPQNEYI